MPKILITDDDLKIRTIFAEILPANGFDIVEASSGHEAVAIFKSSKPDAVLLDLKMPGMDGIQTMGELQKINSSVPVVILTAHGDVPTAVKAIKLGAYDFVLKPPDYDRIIITLKRASEKYAVEKKLNSLSLTMKNSLEHILGKSTKMESVVKQIQQVACSDLSVIIQGETGTGKSYAARLIHNLSSRANGPLTVVDVGNIPETLIESELFGYEKGAFTGADKKKKGFFETANCGTIFIDELQNMSAAIQGKLLRAVEEKTVCNLGSTKPVTIDVRIICATNRDMIKIVREEKTFRDDLFYRLGEFMITIPPLRERVKDIPFFANRFLEETCEEMKKPVAAFSPEAMDLLVSHNWPGNIRELKNVVKRSIILSDGRTIGQDCIVFIETRMPPVSGLFTDGLPVSFPLMSLKEFERIIISQTLKNVAGKKTKAADVLDIDYKTLQKKLRDYKIES